MNQKVPVQLRESDPAFKAARSPVTADLPSGSQHDALVASDAAGTSGNRSAHNTGDGTAPADPRHSRNSRMKIFDKNNHVTWLVVCIVLAGIVGWVLMFTGVIQ
ncbi:MAG: hypothetical protein ACREPQ_01125 [Rhodanobacter sp.]